jgi:disulfide bond formation protein DsbB
LFFALLTVTAFSLLGVAYWSQYGPQQQQPCPLCILQRYAFVFIGIVSLVGAIHGPGRAGSLVYALLVDLWAAAGLALAIWLVSKGHTMKSCIEDPVGVFVNGLPPATDWWPEFFWATGGCGDTYPPILGLTVPVWALVWFALFLGATGTWIALTLKQDRFSRAV